MRIAVMGAGAVGCDIGGRLASAGADVVFIARGERLRALESTGLTILEREAVAVARAKGVTLPDDTEAHALRQLCIEMNAGAKAAQLVDLENGRPLELEYLSGAIQRFGRELGVATPLHSTVYAALRRFLRGAAGRRGGA